MAKLPVIVSFGGINAAGRSSLHHAYRRMVLDKLPTSQASETLHSLASLMGMVKKQSGAWTDSSGELLDIEDFLRQQQNTILNGTLIRQLESSLFDPGQIPFHKKLSLHAHDGKTIDFSLKKKYLPEDIPPGWQVIEHPGNPDYLLIEASGSLDVLMQCFRRSKVNTAGQLPSGFDPAALYQSRNHPRGLQLTVYGASDAINALGIDWQVVANKVAPDQIGVYAGSGLGQLDYNGNGGLLQARLLGRKVTSKQLPLGYAEMPADFINAYILGNLGTTGTNVAACATFLYNLRQAVRDIQSGTHRVVVVGTSEAPLLPEIFDGFATMGALADDTKLRELDNLNESDVIAHRRACRPFGNNAGFTLAESAQFVVLFDDELAMELGANIYGAVNEVFVNADGFKKSIAGPGLGNYITMAKATAATRQIIGESALRNGTYVQAHGTGTPQNRTTESHILAQVAENFGIQAWPVSAIKAHIGHSLASAAGDQLVTSLGVWQHGIIPGITTVDALADDVHRKNLDILLEHRELEPASLAATIINSKGFGGNNASASILAPHVTETMLNRKHGKRKMAAYKNAREQTLVAIADYDSKAINGEATSIYRYGENVRDADAVTMAPDELKISGLKVPVSLQVPNNYKEYCE